MKQNKKGEGKMRCRVEVGLLILSLAFVVSFWGGLGVGIDLGEFRIIPILEANPNRYFEYMRDAFLFCILPPAVGLAYSIIAFVRERKSPTGVLEWWLPLMVVGGFFFFWGVYGLWWTYTTYLDVIQHWVNAFRVRVEIVDLISKVCLAVMVGDILWLFAGTLFMLSPIFKMMLREKGAPTSQRRNTSSIFAISLSLNTRQRKALAYGKRPNLC
jgi:hypothetical protein